MSKIAPTFSQIRALVSDVRKKAPDARVIGVRALGRWAGERVREDGKDRYVIEQCDSPLAMRIALREDAGESALKVLITGLEDLELHDDILIRLARHKLFTIDSWQIIRSFFQAHTLDSRLTRYPWMAEALLDMVSPEDCPAAPGGFLDLETVWGVLLDRAIGLTGPSVDLPAILQWSLDPDRVRRFRVLPVAIRDAVVAWLSQSAGAAAGAVLRCVLANERPDAVPIGLAAYVVFHPAATGALDKAAGRMEERFLGGPVEKGVVHRWSAAAIEVVRPQLTDPSQRRQLLNRSDEILSELLASPFAYLSDVSPLGFDQRLGRFGKALEESLKVEAGIVLTESRDAVQQHDRAAHESRRMERVEMAMRLVRWLELERKAGAYVPDSLAEAASHYLTDGGYADRARLTLRTGDAVGELSEAYSKLCREAGERMELQAKAFAELLRDWTAAGSTGTDVVPVEKILESVVAPLAAGAPVLLVVVDGMSVPVSRELVTDIAGREWVTLCEDGRQSTRPGIATIPSATEFSRTSLLCGSLRTGSSTDELAGFSQHPALMARCKPGKPPLLFHKASLQAGDDSSLAANVRQAIAAADNRVVGVVVNAVDDCLFKGEQVDTRWTRDEIRVLPALLYEARTAGRIIVMVSDHGHVLELSTECRPNEGGDRWRADASKPGAGELAIMGHRVLAGDGKLVAPWAENLRYGIKRNGYHGGLSPQEMIVPIVVLSANAKHPEGWVEAIDPVPFWWEGVEIREVVQPAPVAEPKKVPETLLDWREESGEEQAVTRAEGAIPDWVAALLTSPLYAEQKKLAGRKVPDDALMSRLLAALSRSGGKATTPALARLVQYPPGRMPGLLAMAQRLMNVDGYPVLSRDDASDTVELNKDLMCRQFEVTS